LQNGCTIHYWTGPGSDGCGDVYAGGFILKYLETGEPVESAQFASKVAGIKPGIGKPESFRIRRFLETEKML